MKAGAIYCSSRNKELCHLIWFLFTSIFVLGSSVLCLFYFTKYLYPSVWFSQSLSFSRLFLLFSSSFFNTCKFRTWRTFLSALLTEDASFLCHIVALQRGNVYLTFSFHFLGCGLFWVTGSTSCLSSARFPTQPFIFVHHTHIWSKGIWPQTSLRFYAHSSWRSGLFSKTVNVFSISLWVATSLLQVCSGKIFFDQFQFAHARVKNTDVHWQRIETISSGLAVLFIDCSWNIVISIVYTVRIKCSLWNGCSFMWTLVSNFDIENLRSTNNTKDVCEVWVQHVNFAIIIIV